MNTSGTWSFSRRSSARSWSRVNPLQTYERHEELKSKKDSEKLLEIAKFMQEAGWYARSRGGSAALRQELPGRDKRHRRSSTRSRKFARRYSSKASNRPPRLVSMRKRLPGWGPTRTNISRRCVSPTTGTQPKTLDASTTRPSPISNRQGSICNSCLCIRKAPRPGRPRRSSSWTS